MSMTVRMGACIQICADTPAGVCMYKGGLRGLRRGMNAREHACTMGRVEECAEKDGCGSVDGHVRGT